MQKKLTGNFVGIYKKGNKENLLKKMENLKTRHPKKIIVEWEEIVEKFRENEDYLNKAATPGTDIFLDWTRKGFDKELLTGFVDGPNIVNKRALAMIISEGVFGDRYEVSCVYDEENDNFNIIDYDLDEDGEFRSFKELKTVSLEEFLSCKDIEKEYFPSGGIVQAGSLFHILTSKAEDVNFNDDEEVLERILEIVNEIRLEVKRKELKNYDVTIFEVEHPQNYSDF